MFVLCCFVYSQIASLVRAKAIISLLSYRDVFFFINRELWQRRRRQQRGRQISNRFRLANTFARTSRFLYISLPSLNGYEGVKMPNFRFYGGRKQATANFSFSF